MIFTRSRLTVGAFFAVFVSLVTVGPAVAHAMLKNTEPPVNGRVTGSPKLVQLRFTEALEPKYSQLTITDAAGARLALEPLAAADASSLAATPRVPLAPGVYTVNWISVAADDGHKMSGHYFFTVK